MTNTELIKKKMAELQKKYPQAEIKECLGEYDPEEPILGGDGEIYCSPSNCVCVSECKKFTYLLAGKGDKVEKEEPKVEKEETKTEEKTKVEEPIGETKIILTFQDILEGTTWKGSEPRAESKSRFIWDLLAENKYTEEEIKEKLKEKFGYSDRKVSNMLDTETTSFDEDRKRMVVENKVAVGAIKVEIPKEEPPKVDLPKEEPIKVDPPKIVERIETKVEPPTTIKEEKKPIELKLALGKVSGAISLDLSLGNYEICSMSEFIEGIPRYIGLVRKS